MVNSTNTGVKGVVPQTNITKATEPGGDLFLFVNVRMNTMKMKCIRENIIFLMNGRAVFLSSSDVTDLFPHLMFFSRSLKSRVKIMVDGTLLISRLIPEDAGNYTCVPTNGLLTPPTASAVLTVMRMFLCGLWIR